MGERKKINKDHPDYKSYLSQFNAIVAGMNEEQALAEQEPGTMKGLDGPVVLIQKEYFRRIKELQTEYSYLFQ